MRKKSLDKIEIAESNNAFLREIDKIVEKEGVIAAWGYIAKIGKELEVIENKGLSQALLNRINKKGKLV
ncbi:MAG: hypothetical protein ACP5HJ_02970, partial [Candidatus Micrarchaeia archaeon]